MGSGQSTDGSETHEVHVYTGDKKGAAVKNAEVYVTFTDSVGTVSPEIFLTDDGHDDFKQGKNVSFKITLSGLLKVSEMSIRRDNEGNDDDWYIMKVVVNLISSSGDTQETSIFPLTRWLHGGQTLSIIEFDSVLPQFSNYEQQRKEEMVAMRQQYVLSGKIMGAPPQVEVVPNDEAFTNKYFISIGLDLAVVLGQSFVTNICADDTFQSLKDIESIYDGPLPTPAGVNNWKSEEEFGHQKLAGCNPGMLELCTEIPKNMQELIDNPAMVTMWLENMPIDQAIAAKRLFKIDLTYLADIECTKGKVLPGPTCLLFTKASGDLVPVAIQIMPVAATDNPVFTPSDSEYTWMAAKMWFNFADCSHHQSISHLGFTHLLMESAAVITNRQLSQSHPIYRLLAPHFLYCMSINDLAVKQLVSPGGWVDEVMAIGRIGMFNIIDNQWAKWDLQQDGNVKKAFERKGVSDLPNYFYRIDSLRLWNAIEAYVTEVVNGVYGIDSPSKLLADDYEIQAWKDELVAKAKFNGVPDLTDNAALIEILTVLIFTPSVQHAAVNFGQYDQYGFPPNYPAIMNAGRPKSHDVLREHYVVDSLPTRKQTMQMVQITNILSQRGTQPLGNFEIQYGYDPVAQNALYKFQVALKKIQADIEKDNKTRNHHYDYLLPSDIPNAISI